MRRHRYRDQTRLRERRNQPACAATREVLTVQVAVPDALDVLGVDEVVASFPHNVYRGQIHVVADPTTRTTQPGTQKRGNDRNGQVI